MVMLGLNPNSEHAQLDGSALVVGAMDVSHSWRSFLLLKKYVLTSHKDMINCMIPFLLIKCSDYIINRY